MKRKHPDSEMNESLAQVFDELKSRTILSYTDYKKKFTDYNPNENMYFTMYFTQKSLKFVFSDDKIISRFVHGIEDPGPASGIIIDEELWLNLLFPTTTDIVSQVDRDSYFKKYFTLFCIEIKNDDMLKALSEYLIRWKSEHQNESMTKKIIEKGISDWKVKNIVGYDPEQLKLSRSSFNVSRKDPYSVVDRFSDYVEHCWAEYLNPNPTYYASYFPIIGPSMIGKTSLINAFRKKNEFYAPYICLRSESSSGVPQRTPELADYILKETSDYGITVLSFYLTILEDIIGTDDVEKFNEQWFNDAPKFGPLLERMQERRRTLISKNIETISQDEVHKIFKDLGTKKVVFFFDEARALVNSVRPPASTLFVQLRRVLTFFRPADVMLPSLLTTCFVDTTASLKNFTPLRENDPSARAQQEYMNLLPPFYEISTIDIFSTEAVNISNLFDMKRLFTYGRPFWGACFKVEPAPSIKSVLSIAKMKILGGLDPLSWQFNERDDDSSLIVLSLLGPRVCIQISPISELSETLTSQYLRYCLGFSDDRRFIYTDTCSEPILCEASARILNPTSKAPLHGRFINVIDNLLKKGIVTAGYRGELGARLLFLLAWDNARKDFVNRNPVLNYFSSPMKVLDFFKSLLHENAYKKLLIGWSKNRFNDYYLFFTHFIKINYTPKKSDLMRFYERSAAILCKDNEWGIDIIIPMLRMTKNSAFNQGHISYILVSVKLCATQRDGKYTKSIGFKLNPNYCGIEKMRPNMNPFITIYMNLGAPKSDSKFNIQPRTLRPKKSPANVRFNALLFGLEIFNSTFPLDSISQLLKTTIDPLTEEAEENRRKNPGTKCYLEVVRPLVNKFE